MAIIAKITVGGKLVIEVNADPSVSGVSAPIGSKALFNDAGTGKEYLKVGAADTSWQMVVSGTIDLTPYFKKDGSVKMTGDIQFDSLGRSVGDSAYPVNMYANQIKDETENVAFNVPLRKLTDMSGSDAINFGNSTYIDFYSRLLRGVATPENYDDAANKIYVDDVASTLIPLSQKGMANGVVPLNAQTKIDNQYLPALAITDTFVVASQAAMLALGAQGAEKGDVAVRTDLNKSFILAGTDPSILADWQELLTPTDAVLSVNGKIGAVTLTTSDIAEGTNLYFTDARAVSAVVASNKAWLAGDAVTDLNTASAVKYFGTKSGDFDISFYRNNLKQFDLKNNIMSFASNYTLQGSGIDLIGQGANGNLNFLAGSNGTIASIAGTIQQNTQRKNGYLYDQAVNYQIAFGTMERYYKPTLLTTDTSKLITVNHEYGDKDKMFKITIIFNTDAGGSATLVKTVHVDKLNNLVIVQDDFTSKNAGASALDVVITNVAAQLRVTVAMPTGVKSISLKSEETTMFY